MSTSKQHKTHVIFVNNDELDIFIIYLFIRKFIIYVIFNVLRWKKKIIWIFGQYQIQQR
jgi:hypothetical protein